MIIGREMGGGGLSPLIFKCTYFSKCLIHTKKKPQNYSQKASEALSGGQKFQIFLGEHAPQMVDGYLL